MLHVERGYTSLESYEYVYKNAVRMYMEVSYHGTWYRYIVRRTIRTYCYCTRILFGAKQNPVPLIL